MAVDVAVAMDVDIAVLGMAMAVVGVAVVGVAVVGVVVGLCMVVVVDVAMAMWGEENGGWRKLNHQRVNASTFKLQSSTLTRDVEAQRVSGASHEHVTFRLRKVSHRRAHAARVSQLTNVAASQTNILISLEIK